MNKKHYQSGFATHLIIIVAVVVVVLGGLGFAYWNSVREKEAADKAAQTVLQNGIDAVNAVKEAADPTSPAVVAPVVTPAAEPVVVSTCAADKTSALVPFNTQIASLQDQIGALSTSMQQQIASGSTENIATIQADMASINSQIITLQSQMADTASGYAC